MSEIENELNSKPLPDAEEVRRALIRLLRILAIRTAKELADDLNVGDSDESQ